MTPPPKPKRSRRNVPGPVPVPSRWGVPDPDICQHTVGASGRAVAERVYEALFTGADAIAFAPWKTKRMIVERILAAIERAMGEGEIDGI